MSFEYKAIQKRNPADPGAPKKWYASPIVTGYITEYELAEEIADISTVSFIDTDAVLKAFAKVVPKHLNDGKIVKLLDFGTFRLTISSEGVDTEDELSSHHIKKTRYHFRPGRLFSDIANKVKFIKVKKEAKK
ncbi:MAG: HU family DNA-binding protein [Bacteroidales bacterium]|nr:HU family DNA-binding protein [Bacteroidales bacterium]